MVKIDLSGRQILITGAFGGIAEFIVARLEEAGATMILTDLLPPEQACRENYHRMDVTNAAEVARVVAAVFEKHPRLDIALGHAGGTGIHPFRRSG
jgi:NAD(P)-dependent dehydrogenase (short-subunit alcohol dehydrogenase family)